MRLPLLAVPMLLAWTLSTPVVAKGLPGAPDSAIETESKPAPRRVVALLPPTISGELSPQARVSLIDAIQTGFHHEDLELISELARDCSDAKCVRDFGRELGADYVVTTLVTTGARNFHVELRVLPVEDERAATLSSIDCPICGVEEVGDQLASKARVLRDWLLADSEPARVSIVGSPESAVISLDGEREGALPFEVMLEPGAHELIISAAGHHTKHIEFTTVAGSSLELVAELEPEAALIIEDLPVPVDETGTKSRGWQRPVGWIAVGVGAASLVTGVTFLALHGREHLGRCKDPANIDAEGDCKWVYGSIPEGVVFTIGGAVLAGVGATLLVRHIRRPRQALDARLQIGLGLEHVSVSLEF